MTGYLGKTKQPTKNKRNWKTNLKWSLLKWLKSRSPHFPLYQEDSKFHLVPWCLLHGCYSDCGPWASSISVNWEPIRRTESQAPLQTCWIRIHFLMVPRWFVGTLKFTMLCLLYFHPSWGDSFLSLSTCYYLYVCALHTQMGRSNY